jgi:hypothetical protein
MKTKHILFLVDNYLPGYKSGGPVKTVYSAARALQKKGFVCIILCNDHDLGSIKRYENIKDGVNCISFTRVIYLRRGLSGYIKLLTILCTKRFDFFHLNSYFSFKFSILPRIFLWIIGFKKKVVLAPRGEFSVAALTLKSIKKFFFIQVMKLAHIDSKFSWHFSTNIEKNDAYRVFPDINKYHIANDLSFPISLTDSCGLLPSIIDADVKILSCSRISRVKNIEFIFLVLQDVKARVCIDYYGPIEDSVYFEELEALVKFLPENISFKFCGNLEPNLLYSTFRNYDLFLHPSFSENYGHVIAEALFSGLPVLIGPDTPWSHVMNNKVGWCFSFEELISFQGVIENYKELSIGERSDLHEKVAIWAEKNINTNAVILDWENIFN